MRRLLRLEDVGVRPANPALTAPLLIVTSPATRSEADTCAPAGRCVPHLRRSGVLVLCTQRFRARLTCVAPLALRPERSKPESGLKPFSCVRAYRDAP